MVFQRYIIVEKYNIVEKNMCKVLYLKLYFGVCTNIVHIFKTARWKQFEHLWHMSIALARLWQAHV